jgi:hypothetical protein
MLDEQSDCSDAMPDARGLEQRQRLGGHLLRWRARGGRSRWLFGKCAAVAAALPSVDDHCRTRRVGQTSESCFDESYRL